MQSENINELAKALNLLQKELKPAEKNQVNPFFNNKYADLQSVIDASKEPLAKHGLSVVSIGEPDSDGNNFLKIILMHTSGQFITSKFKLNPVKNDPQGVGSAISYYRRYGISSLLNIVSDIDDDGNRASHFNSPSKPSFQPKKAVKEAVRAAGQPVAKQGTKNDGKASPKQVNYIKKVANDNGWTPETLSIEIAQRFHVAGVEELSWRHVNPLLEALKQGPPPENMETPIEQDDLPF